MERRCFFRVLLALFGSLIGLNSCFWKASNRFTYAPVSKQEFVVKAQFMQYACGDDVDDMNVLEVSDSQYNYLIGLDIDPIIDKRQKVLKDVFYEHRTEEFGMVYLLTGTINRCKSNGCELTAPLFWVTELRLLSGESKPVYGD